jgi:hypothetical protein
LLNILLLLLPTSLLNKLLTKRMYIINSVADADTVNGFNSSSVNAECKFGTIPVFKKFKVEFCEIYATF